MTLQEATNLVNQIYDTMSVSFGPFDIRSKVITQNELRSDGLQVIAWLCKTNPALPPLGDPNP